MFDKKNLREKNRKIRASLFESGEICEISARIVEQIVKEDYFVRAKHVLIFHPKQGEIDLLELLKVQDKQFYLPRCRENARAENTECEMEICPYCADDKLCKNKYGILEPVCEPITDLTALDVIFMPALGADLHGNRLGHGKGYYDRFFAANKNLRAKKVVVISNNLICEKINCDTHDIQYDELITD